jgi:TetR/AcrR family transcriptional regulator
MPRSSHTRERILERATAEFASKGFDGARMDEIAARCGVRKYTVYYYFRSKEGLFIAVLNRVYRTFRARQREISVRGLPPVQAMRQLVKHTFAAFLEHPDAVAIMNSENIHKGRHIRRLGGLRELYNPLVETIREVIRKGADQGTFRRKIDPVRMYIALSGLCYVYIANRFTLEAIFGLNMISKTSQRRWVDHVTEMILSYCYKESPKGRPNGGRGIFRRQREPD